MTRASVLFYIKVGPHIDSPEWLLPQATEHYVQTSESVPVSA